MKVKFNKNQRNLFEKTQEALFITEKVCNSYWEYFKTWYCQKHNDIFFRANKEQYGMCWKCKDELYSNDKILVEDINGKRLIKIYPLQPYHTSDIMVIQKFFESLENREENENMKVEKSIKIEDGKYNGKITDVIEKTEPYEYTDFEIEFDINGTNVKLLYGCPSIVKIDENGNPSTKLAETLKEFGFNFKMEQEITIVDLKNHFIGKKVTSLITNKKVKNKTTGQEHEYAQVVTLKLKK